MTQLVTPPNLGPYDSTSASGSEQDGLTWYLEQIGARRECDVLTRDEERALAIRVRAGDMRARKELVEHNLRLVIAIARKYLGRGVELLDLIAAGNRGLMHAIDLYDLAWGTKLSTYATPWIRQHCHRICEEEGRMIALPSWLQTRAMEEKREALGAVIRPPISLDAPLTWNNVLGHEHDGEELTLYSLMEDGSVASVEEQAEASDAQERAWGELVRLFEAANLTAREQRVLALRYAGGDGGQAMTLEQVSRVLHISRERVRQIEAKAMRLLRVAAGVERGDDTDQAELWAS